MAKILVDLKQRQCEDWLIGYDSRELYQQALELYLQLKQKSEFNRPLQQTNSKTGETPIPQEFLEKSNKTPKIILAERDPIKFLAGFIAAIAADCPVFLCNPDWVESEWQQVFELAQPDLILGQEVAERLGHYQSPITNYQLPITNSPIMIPTGGSSGKVKFAIHSWETLTASVQGFTQYFQVSKVNSFCVLPLYHVSGLMQFMRSFTTGGRLVVLRFKELESSIKPQINLSDFFISLVPTQLQRLLQQDATWLSQFQTVLLGGAPAWKELLETARSRRIRLAPTYGMTETASQIVTLKPADFLNGNNSSGQVLPHVQVKICSHNGKILAPRKIGSITIQSNSLCLGYYGETIPIKTNFKPDDLGYFDENGYLKIVGRNSNKIITGGENVFPSEVEAAIQSTNLVIDVCVIGLPDRHWGQVVTAIYVPKHAKVSTDILRMALEHKLSKFKRPKYWYSVERLPRNSQGKVDCEQIKKIAMMWHLHLHTVAAIE